MAQQFSSSAQSWLQNKPITASSSGMSGFSPTANGWLMQKPQATTKTKVITPIKPVSKPVATQAPSFLQNIYTNFQSMFNKAIGAKAGEGLQNGEFVPRDTSIKSPIPQKQMLPKAKTANTHTKADTVAEFAAGAANTPAEAVKGVGDIAQHGKTNTLQQNAGDVGAIASALLMGFTGGGSSIVKQGISQVAKNTGKQALVQVGKAISKDAIVGGAFGIFGGLQSGRDITNLKDYVNNMIGNVKTGVGISAGAGIVVHGTHAAVKDVAIPLVKGATTKAGAVFVKNATTKPEIVHMQLDPKIAQGVAVGNEELAKSSAGKAIIKEAIIADQTGEQVGVTPSESGKYTLPGGQKVDVATVPEYKPNDVVKTFKQNVEDYRSYGGASAGTRTENAALRDIEQHAQTSEVKAHTQSEVKKAIDSGEIQPNADGTITLYRGGKPSDHNNLVSASYDKQIAQNFAKDGQLHEFKVKPEDVKAFIGKAEKEVLVDKSRIIPEDSSKVTKSFDTKGNEIVQKNKKVLKGHEVEAIRDVVVAKMNHLRETSHSEEDFVKGIDSLVKDITERSQGDKQVMSALRTELNQEMYGMVGKSGNYKEDFKNLQEMMKDTSGTGKVLTNLDDHIKAIDEKLISTPDKEYKAPAFVKERQTKQTGVATVQIPVGEGKLRDSAAFKRLVEHLETKSPEELKNLNGTELKYHQMNISDQAEKSLEFVQKDPQRAYRVAKGYENPPEGIVAHAVNQALADQAYEEKNYTLWSDLEKSGSLALTRAGQEIVMERGRYSDTSPHAFMKQLIKTRIQRLGNITESIKPGDASVKHNIETATGRAMAKIDKEVTKLKETLTKEQRKVKTAQNIIDQLVCK